MDGDVTVRSEAGRGAVFRLELPLVRAEAIDEVAPDAAEVRSLVILDRNPISRSMLRAVLEARAGSIQFAGSVDEAVALMRAGGVARLLIDDATIKACEDPPAALTMLATVASETNIVSCLLWPLPDNDQRAGLLATGITMLVAKPISGAALLETLFPLDKNDMDSAKHLVTQAA